MFQSRTCKIFKYLALFLGIAISLAVTSGWKNSGDPPLFRSILDRELSTAKTLLESGADVNATTAEGGTPLHYAVESGQYALTHLFLQHGADVHARYRQDWMPLHFAAKRGHVDIADLLIQYGAEVNGRDGAITPLHVAVQEHQHRMVSFLLGKGATVNTVFKEGWTALHLAAQSGDTDITRMLLDAGAAINATNVVGLTPLHSAAFSGHREVTHYLITRGARCSLPDQPLPGLSAKNLSALYSSFQEIIQSCPNTLAKS